MGDDRDATGVNLDSMYQRAVAAGAGAALGLGIPGPLGSIVGATAGVFLEPLAEKVWGEIHADSQRRQNEALTVAQEVMAVSLKELEQRIMASDESRLQAGIALSAASRTAWPPKIVALGRALGTGLMASDDTRIDPQPLIMTVLADIEFPHASLLDLLVRYHFIATPDGRRSKPYVIPADSPWPTGRWPWQWDQIALARPTLKPVLNILMSTLDRHNLITWNHTYLPTKFGEEILEILLKAGAEFTDS